MSLFLICLLISVSIADIPGNFTDLSKCKLSHLGIEYTGNVYKSESNVRCQSWSSNQPHKVRSDLNDAKFPDGSRENARYYCRNPDKSLLGPWCYTLNTDLEFETCGLKLCSFSECKMTGPGIEYAGTNNKGMSGRKCLKWNKKRSKVKEFGRILSRDKFEKIRFPENSLSDAKKYCRNPDGDIGGPWCYIQNSDDDIFREYCDVPFCNDEDCSFFTKDNNKFIHYTAFNETLSNLTFGIKLWDSDSVLEANGILALTVLALPLTGKEIEDLGIGIAIFISNKQIGLKYGNSEKPEYETVYNLLKSTEFTWFSFTWHAGFISLNLQGVNKPIFLAEYKMKRNLLSVKKNSFKFYSAKGTNLFWSFPFCMDDFDCDVQTTTGDFFQQFWPLRETNIGYDLYFHLRAFHSVEILLLSTPTRNFPHFKVILSDKNGFTRILYKEYENSASFTLKEFQLDNLLKYWEWCEYSISFYANTMQIYAKKSVGIQMIAEIHHESVKLMRWFSVSSKTTAHWSFYCTPPMFSNPPPALLPECAFDTQELEYKGTQDVTELGLACLPWSGTKLTNFQWPKTNESVLKVWNYCRDPLEEKKGTYCYVIDAESNVSKQYCKLRKCKSEECKMAGTGNDYIGMVNSTRSNRTCINWTENKLKIWNDTLFPDMTAEKAENFCRNPARDISGSWCYTNDSKVRKDVCNIRDCDKPEECTVIVSSMNKDRRVYILPQWKEFTGLQFALKEWNPDMLDGVSFHIRPNNSNNELKLTIGANYNELLLLHYNNKLLERKTFPHLVTSGKWTEFWLQIRAGELRLGYKGVPTALFEWKNEEIKFEPVFISYTSIFGKPIGIFFNCDECHTEIVNNNDFFHFFPLRLWNGEENKLKLNLRGEGIAFISLIQFPNDFNYFHLKLNNFNNLITIVTQEKGMSKTMDYFRFSEKLFTNTFWTNFTIYFNENIIKMYKNGKFLFQYKSEQPLLFYYFTIGVENGEITWSSNCLPLDIDGKPRDGGWSKWGRWTCSVSCGGGEGFRTRTCSNPRPNIFGKLCSGPALSTGKCNDFECGDLSDVTLDLIQQNLQKTQDSLVVKHGGNVIIKNNANILKRIQQESPNSHYEWTLNGLFLKPSQRIQFFNGNIRLLNVNNSDSGVYTAILFRINRKRLVIKVNTLAIIMGDFLITTRATRQFTLSCNAVVLAYIYSDLSLKLYLNNKLYHNYGITTLAAVNDIQFKSLNESLTGEWKCIVEQKDLNLKWITNCVKLLVKKAPNLYTNLMEDKLTAPLFGRLKTEKHVKLVLIGIVLGVIFLVVGFLVVYFKFCTLKTRHKRNRRFK